MQGGVAFLGGGVDGRAPRQQLGNDVDVAFFGGEVQRVQPVLCDTHTHTQTHTHAYNFRRFVSERAEQAR